MSQGIDEPDRPQARAGTGPDLFSKFDPLIEMRANLLSTGQEDPYNLVMERVLSPTKAICNGRETILLGTYNYMGMTFDPDVIAAGKQALDEFGRSKLLRMRCSRLLQNCATRRVCNSIRSSM